ncbi:MAG: hypothetical protein PVSMB7_00760 [Chloroflexota bacterium]
MEYAIIFTPGPAWDPNEPPEKQRLDKHNKHLHDLRTRRKLLQAASFDKHNRSVAVVEVGSEAEAESLLQQDPAVQDGVLRGELRPWHIVFGLQAAASRPTPVES